MWNLWRLSQTTGQRPSALLRIEQWTAERFGFDGWWVALQFDNAVTYLGSYVESMMNETEKQIVNGVEQYVPRYESVEQFFSELERGMASGQKGLDALIADAKQLGIYRKV